MKPIANFVLCVVASLIPHTWREKKLVSYIETKELALLVAW
jgi:hypothetical protein